MAPIWYISLIPAIVDDYGFLFEGFLITFTHTQTYTEKVRLKETNMPALGITFISKSVCGLSNKQEYGTEVKTEVLLLLLVEKTEVW